MTTAQRIGFVGLGDQGAPIARRIADAGWPLHVWARRPASVEPLAECAVQIESSPLALGRSCDLVGICVAKDADVLDVADRGGEGIIHGLRPGGVLVIHSTVAPGTVVELERIGRELGVHVLDAPVSGGHRGAVAGTLTVIVGGDERPVALARPVFEAFASTIAHVGGVGTAQLTKLLNNNLCFANATLAIDALELARRLGMDVDVVAEVLRVSSGGSVGLSIVLNQETLAKATGPTSNLAKDVNHLRVLLEREELHEELMPSVAARATDRIRSFADWRGVRLEDDNDE